MHDFTGGEFIVMGVPGPTVDPATREIIEKVQPSGFILFARNIKEPKQLRELTDSLRTLVKHEPVITIDQEGGRVSRLKEFMSEPPSARQFAKHGTTKHIETHGTLTGKLLRLFGFNSNLAPVLDIEVDENNDNSLNQRTYGTNAQQVIANALAFASSMSAEGILSCGKHFPGYSCAVVDPHHHLPVVQRSLSELENLEWLPFKHCAAHLDMMMIGHVSYPNIDPSKLPASLSPYMVRTILREKLGFAGCTITDDMDMGAIKTAYGSAEAAASALKAGNDLMLVCHNIEGVPEIAQALTKVADSVKAEAYGRILSMRKRLAAPAQFALPEFARLDAAVKRLREEVLQPAAQNA